MCPAAILCSYIGTNVIDSVWQEQSEGLLPYTLSTGSVLSTPKAHLHHLYTGKKTMKHALKIGKSPSNWEPQMKQPVSPGLALSPWRTSRLRTICHFLHLPAMLQGMKEMNFKQWGLVFNYYDLLAPGQWSSPWTWHFSFPSAPGSLQSLLLHPKQSFSLSSLLFIAAWPEDSRVTPESS